MHPPQTDGKPDPGHMLLRYWRPGIVLTSMGICCSSIWVRMVFRNDTTTLLCDLMNEEKNGAGDNSFGFVDDDKDRTIRKCRCKTSSISSSVRLSFPERKCTIQYVMTYPASRESSEVWNGTSTRRYFLQTSENVECPSLFLITKPCA